jgi:diguanylate cyclase (GGDEF)-like protein
MPAVPADRFAMRLQRIRDWLPEGSTLPDGVWAGRHRRILALVWLHVPALFAFALVRRQGVAHGLAEAMSVAVFALAASSLRAHRRLSTVVTALGLFTSSAILVHLSGGVIEMHFHYFVMVAVVTLYQDWRPFLFAIGYVVLQHGVAGVLAPESVYNHAAAISHPWRWAGIHGLFILGMSAAGIASWRLNEALLGDRLRAEAELHETLSLLNATLDSTADGILAVDAAGTVVSCNRRFVEMFRPPAALLAARNGHEVLAFVDDLVQGGEAFPAKLVDLGLHPDAESHDTIELADGRRFERYSKPQRVDEATVGRVWSFHDVTERERLTADLAHQAFHDSLTGLANQALFRNRVEHALTRADRHGTSLAVLFLDLDNFKTANDSLGHRAGDEVLVAVAGRLEGCLRGTDTAARLGGDEFAVLMEDVDGESDALEVARRMIGALDEPLTAAGREVFVGASVGIAFGSAGTGADQLLRSADLAMYTAKRRGKGRAQVFEPAMHAAAVERLEVEAELRRALDRGGLTLHYQPIVALDTGRTCGVEALVRWPRPDGDLLSPAMFIPLAEETSLIHELGRQVLVQACTQTRRWQLGHPDHRDLTVSVNLSPRQLTDDRLLEDVRTALGVSGLPAGSLVLEITEGAMMHDDVTAMAKLDQLRALGVRIAVDDFGTGYSSLSYLRRLPLDILKIDRAFVTAIGSEGGESMLETIVSLAHALKLRTVAEGVETADQAEVLARLGCDLAQGYHLARPVAPERLEAMLAVGFGTPALEALAT